MYISAVIVLMGILTVAIPMNVNASGLSESDFPEHPEAYCILNEDYSPCANVDICDDEGEITSEDQFCTGEAVRNLPYPPGGCPEDYHGIEDDETGQCYSDDIECPEGTIMKEFDRAEGHGCSEYKINCDLNENHPLCNGEERTDGIKVCDQPDHPGYKFCNDN